MWVVPQMKEIPQFRDLRLFYTREQHGKCLIREVCFPIFFIVLVFCTWYSLAWLGPPSTHSIIYFLLCNRHWLWLFVGRYLQNNQLKELPEGIFRNNTKLWFLRVDIFLSNFPQSHNHIQIPNEPIRISVYCPDIQRYQVTNLIWLRYHAHLADLGTEKT